MRNTLKVLFYVKRAARARDGNLPIYGRITIRGRRIGFSTHLAVAPAAWDVAQNRVLGRSVEAARLNRELDRLRLEAERCYEQLCLSSADVSPEQVRDALLETHLSPTRLIDYFRRHNQQFALRVGIDRSQSSLYRYESTLRHLEAFLPEHTAREDVALSEVDRHLLTAFHRYLLHTCARRPNTVWVYLSALKHLLRRARAEGLMQHDPFLDYKLQSEYVQRTFLSEDELTRLMSLTGLSRSQELLRDSFLFSAFTGLSFVDLKQLTPDHVTLRGRRHWIELARQKTGVQVQVCLLDLPLMILRKWEPHIRSECYFPLPSNGWVNRSLVQLMARAGIEKRVTFHAARHTFATTIALSKGVSIETISKLLGHSSIRTTQIYATVTHDYLNLQLDRLSKRIDALCADWKGVTTDEKGALVAQ